MSYYGVRKVKIIKKENGLYNVACEAYDSSITDYKGNRIWDAYPNGIYKEDKTKEEVEKQLFIDALDGNLHGVGGKYTCISWSNGSLTLPKEQVEELSILDKKRWDNNLSQEEKAQACEEYREKRYKYWYETWQKYLADKKSAGKHIIEVSYAGQRLFIKGLGSRTMKFTNFRENAKVFNKPVYELEQLISSFNVAQPEFIEV